MLSRSRLLSKYSSLYSSNNRQESSTLLGTSSSLKHNRFQKRSFSVSRVILETKGIQEVVSLKTKLSRSNSFAHPKLNYRQSFTQTQVFKRSNDKSVLRPASSGALRNNINPFQEKRKLMIQIQKQLGRQMPTYSKIKTAQSLGLKNKFSSLVLRPKIIEQNRKKNSIKPLRNPFALTSYVESEYI